MSYSSVRSFEVKFKKSQANGNKSYKLIQLSNGIPVLLVSDPSKDTAACSVSVCTGSHNDSEVTGLAHFCEHMLFLGTREFPLANAFRETLDLHGGCSNAFTTGEQTCFFFEIPINEVEVEEEPLFSHLLRNFSSFFKCPLFKENLMKREVVAVNNEHESNVTNSDKILYHSLKLAASDLHKFHRFGTGNLHTLVDLPKLKSIDLRKELQQYFNSYFTSERISIVITGPQSLNHLQKLVSKYFSSIRSTEVSLASARSSTSETSIIHLKVPISTRLSALFSSKECTISRQQLGIQTSFSILQDNYNSSEIYPRASLNQLIFIKSNQCSTLRLYFPIFSTSHIPNLTLYQSAWCNLIGDEAKESLCDYLTNTLGYITSMFVFTQTLAVENNVLTLDIELTMLGLKRFESLLLIVCKYVNEIAGLPLDYLSSYLNEIVTMTKLNYYYKDNSSTLMNEISELSQTLQDNMSSLGYENILKGYKDLDDQDQDYMGDLSENTKDYWNHKSLEFSSLTKKFLNWSNFNMILLAANDSALHHVSFAKYDRQSYDENYNFNYKFYSIHPLELYKKILSCSDNACSFPQLNQFMSSTQLELNKLIMENSENNSQYQTKRNGHDNKPELLFHSNSFELWFKSESESLFENRICVSFQFTSCNLSTTAHNLTCVELLCGLIAADLKKTLYKGELIGFSWGIFPNHLSRPSIGINLSGISRDFLTILEFIVVHLIQFFKNDIQELSYKDFKKVRVQFRKDMDDLINSNGLKQSVAGSVLFLEENVFGMEERIEALDEIDLNDLKEIATAMLSRSKYTEILVTGDTTSSFATKISHAINQLTNHERTSLVEIEIPFPSSYLIQPGKNYIFSMKNSNKEDPLNTQFYYIQLGVRDELRVRSMAKLLSYFISLSCSYELRTRKQLGYVVLNGIKLNRDTVGLYILVMSADYSSSEILIELETYFQQQELKLLGLTEAAFNSRILQPFLNSLNNDEDDGGIPSNFVYSMAPARSSTNFNRESEIYQLHNSYWEKIISKNYRFDGLKGNDEIDLGFLESVTRNDFLSYYNKYVSTMSGSRSSLSIGIDTSMENSDSQKKLMKTQVKYLLSSKGFSVTSDEVESILEAAEYDSNLLPKQLFQFFKSRDMAAKFIYTSLKDRGSALVMERVRALKSSIDGDKNDNQASIYWAKYTKNFGNSGKAASTICLSDVEQFHNESIVVNRILDRSVSDRLHYFIHTIHDFSEHELEDDAYSLDSSYWQDS